jgi:hypothetical protein
VPTNAIDICATDSTCQVAQLHLPYLTLAQSLNTIELQADPKIPHESHHKAPKTERSGQIH